MITAQEARNLNPSVEVEKILSQIEVLITDAAMAGKDSIRVRAFGFGDSAWYGSSNPKGFAVQVAVINRLRELGFGASIGVEERQFADIYLEITW